MTRIKSTVLRNGKTANDETMKFEADEVEMEEPVPVTIEFGDEVVGETEEVNVTDEHIEVVLEADEEAVEELVDENGFDIAPKVLGEEEGEDFRVEELEELAFVRAHADEKLEDNLEVLDEDD